MPPRSSMGTFSSSLSMVNVDGQLLWTVAEERAWECEIERVQHIVSVIRNENDNYCDIRNDNNLSHLLYRPICVTTREKRNNDELFASAMSKCECSATWLVALKYQYNQNRYLKLYDGTLLLTTLVQYLKVYLSRDEQHWNKSHSQNWCRDTAIHHNIRWLGNHSGSLSWLWKSNNNKGRVYWFAWFYMLWS